jgi:anhydro-N-acetylmuramic acid kinase
VDFAELDGPGMTIGLDPGATLTALGLMSGTSLDAIDAAIVRTDGLLQVEPVAFRSIRYSPRLRGRLRSVLGATGPSPSLRAVELAMTEAHADIVDILLKENNVSKSNIDIIGFHGHTIDHRPDEGQTWQIGDSRDLSDATGLPVVSAFRLADVAAGGQGAPFAPLYHAARAAGAPKPLAILNVGGVANVTWLGERGTAEEPEILAFDTGPGGAMVDDWMRSRTGAPFDRGGGLANLGTVDEVAIAGLLSDGYFARVPPKSLDRNRFTFEPPPGLATADGAATLTAFTAQAVVAACTFFPVPARHWLVTGGGRHNKTLMTMLSRALEQEVKPVEAVGWNGDALEAEAFAYLAVRSLKGLPLSLPTTTGCAEPMTGGTLWPTPAPSG